MVNIDRKLDAESKDVAFISKPVIIIIIFIFLIPIVFTIYSVSNHEKITVGIVLTTDNLSSDAEIARDSLNQFHSIFDAKILDIRFNESTVRVSNGMYLTDDYFDAKFAKSVRNKYKIDVIMILTNRTINNWLGDRKAMWGQADTKNVMTLVTNAYFQYKASTHESYIKKTTIHEVLHLLGYTHPLDDRKCIMRYATLDTELCDENKIELPYRLSLWKIGVGHEFGVAVFLINISLGFLLSIFCIAIMLIIQIIFKKYFYKKSKINQDPLIIGISMYVMIFFISTLVYSFYPRMVLLIISIFIYTIIESLYYESETKKGSFAQKDLGNK